MNSEKLDHWLMCCSPGAVKTSIFKRCLKNKKCCMNWYFSCVCVSKPFWIWLAIWSGTYFGPLNLYTDVRNFMMWVNLGIWAIFGQRVGVKLYTQGGQTAKWQTNYINVVLSSKKIFCISYHKIRILISVIIITTITLVLLSLQPQSSIVHLSRM